MEENGSKEESRKTGDCLARSSADIPEPGAMQKSSKTAWLSIFEVFGLSKLGEHLHAERESVKKVPLIVVICFCAGIWIRGCWDDSRIELVKDNLEKAQGATLEAERGFDKYQNLYNQDENTIGPLRQIADEKFATSPPDKRVDLLLQKMESLQNDIDLKILASNPISAPIASASADISIRFSIPDKSDVGNKLVMVGTGAAFGINNTVLIMVFNGGTTSVSTSDGIGILTTTCSALQSQNSTYIGKPVSSLINAAFIEIATGAIPANSTILGGNARWVINGLVPLNFEIPAQKMNGHTIMIMKLIDGVKPLSPIPDKSASQSQPKL